MLAWEGQELNLASFVKSLQSDVVVLIEIGILNLCHGSISLHLPEPLSLLGVDNGVSIEHDKHGSIEGSEPLVDGGSHVSLVVSQRQEYAVSQIFLEVSGISEVTSRAEEVLHNIEVDHIVSNEVNDVAHETSISAVGDGSHSSMRTSECDKVPDWDLSGTLLNNISSNETSLRQTQDVEFALEILVSEDGGAGLLGLGLKVFKDGGSRAGSDLDALRDCAGLVGDSVGEVLHASVSAGVSETVEDGGGGARRGLGIGEGGKSE